MAVVITPESELGKELAKWEQHHTQYTAGSQPGNPYVYRPFPAMYYKAFPQENGQIACLLPAPQAHEYLSEREYQRAELVTAAHNARCTRVVQSEADARIAKGQGWRESPAEAIAFYEETQQAIAREAAEAAYAVQRMSETARAEFAAAQQDTHEHVVDVVSAPKKRGRKARAANAVEE